jgi:hypothetical protein
MPIILSSTNADPPLLPRLIAALTCTINPCACPY